MIRELIWKDKAVQLLNKQQQHGPAKSRFFLISLNDFFVHTLERGTKQRGDTNQSAEKRSKLQKDSQLDNIPADYHCVKGHGGVQRKKQFHLHRWLLRYKHLAVSVTVKNSVDPKLT